ncbi:MAG: acyltransferase [Prevotella sp.]|nr:acyltransferase [Prevotella sp.]
MMPYSMVLALNHGRVEVGEYTTISMFSRISCMGRIRIGNYVEMGPNVFIGDHNHAYEDISRPIKLQGVSWRPTEDGSPNIEIGDETWIGTHVAIIGNVKIGRHCVIGANAVVNKDIPDYSIAVGVPARIVKRYDTETKRWIAVKRPD